MITESNKDLRERLAKLRPGDHLCCIYETEEEFCGVVVPFMMHGLDKGDKVIYITDSHTAGEVLKHLRGEGLAPDNFLSKKQLIILSAKETYLKGGVFDPDAMIKMLGEAEESALSEGYSALRVTGEMSWVLSEPEGWGRLMEYEAKLNRFFPGSKSMAICQYDRNKFCPEVLLDVLRTHPVAVTGMQMYDNSYYAPPDEFLGEDSAEHELSRWIYNLNQRDEAERVVRESEERFRSICENMSLLMCRFTQDSTLTYVNKAYCDYFGKSPEELIGQKFLDLIPANERKAVKDKYMALSPDAPSLTYEHMVETDAGIRWQEWIDTALFNKKEEISFFQSVGRDITVQKEYKEELREYKRKLNRAQIYAKAGAWEYDILSGNLYWSSECEELFGLKEGSFKGTFEAFLEYVHPDDKDYVIERNNPITELRLGTPLEYDHRIVTEGGDVLWVRERAGVTTDSEGNPAQIAGFVFNITEQKIIEEHAAKALRVKSDFIAVVSHELRTPLTIIKEGALLLFDEILGPLNPEQKKILSHITVNIDGLTRLISNVLDFRTHEKGEHNLELGLNNINKLAADAVELFKNQAAKKGLKLLTEFDEEIGEIELDAAGLTQVLVNLVDNAIKCTAKGSVTVKSRLRDDGSVEVSVADTGRGINPDFSEAIFDPFMQIGGISDRVSGGTGLGLPISQKIIELHKGKIWYEPAEEGGTRFIFSLPGRQKEQP